MDKKFDKPWNTTGMTWLDAPVPGPWAVCNSHAAHWLVVNTDSGRTRRVGPVRTARTNYFDRAMLLAIERNVALLRKRITTARGLALVDKIDTHWPLDDKAADKRDRLIEQIQRLL